MPFPLIPLIGAGLSALGVLGGGRAKGRADEAQINDQRDRTALAGAQFNMQAPGMRAGNAVRGDVLANAQDAQIQGPVTGTKGRVPQITGGLRPSLMSGNTRALGSQMSRDALLSQMSGPAFQPTPTPQAGGFDTFLNIAGGVGDLMGILQNVPGFNKPKPGPQLQEPISQNVQLPRF